MNIEMERDCPVCTDTYSKMIRKKIQCPHCGYECCIACVRRYLLSSITEPACMSCKVQYGYDFLLETLPQSFWNNDYKEFRKNLLLKQEESYLPDTQDCVQRINLVKGFQKFINGRRAMIKRMMRMQGLLERRLERMQSRVHDDKMGTITIEENDPMFQHFEADGTPKRNDLGEFMCILRTPINAEDHGGHQNVSTASLVISCPNEECRGFIKGEQTKCMLCNTRICPKCIKITTGDDQHECTQDDIDTVRLLKTNTKSCPSCFTPIYKTSGCDQMWCVKCHQAFSWRTGKTINTTVHNPHYYEWVRMSNQGGGTMPRNPMDIPCGGLISIHEIEHVFPTRHYDWAYRVHQIITHTENHTIPRCNDQVAVNNGRKELRVMYLCNNISKEFWSHELYRREKASEKYRRYMQIMQTFVAVASEWFRQVYIQRPGDDSFDARIQELSQFMKYMNNEIGKLNYRFKSSLPIIPLA